MRDFNAHWHYTIDADADETCLEQVSGHTRRNQLQRFTRVFNSSSPGRHATIIRRGNDHTISRKSSAIYRRRVLPTARRLASSELRAVISVVYLVSLRKRGNMFSPALVCLCMCLSVNTRTKKIFVDGFVPNFMGRFLGEKERPSSCFVAIGRRMWK